MEDQDRNLFRRTVRSENQTNGKFVHPLSPADQEAARLKALDDKLMTDLRMELKNQEADPAR